MAVGFYIKKLILTGASKKLVRIEFTLGLNVVAGASDTGKTFIFQCIDFMLGAQTPPKEIEESKGYEKLFLVISTHNEKIYTLQRVITGGAFLLKEGDEDSPSPYVPYRDRMGSDPQNISTFLLSLCALDDILLKTNASNKKAKLSFRDVAGLCLVDEITIITERSPVYHSGESTVKTKEKSLFQYFLTGEDAASLTEVEDPTILKSRIAGRIEVLDEFISKTQEKLNEYKGLNVDELEKQLLNQYEKLNLDYRTSLDEADRLRNQKSKFFENLSKLQSKILFNQELLERFELLEKHYVSDRKRLEFISEGSFLLNQLNSVYCPICGTEMKESHAGHLQEFQRNNEEFEQSLQSELEKITLKEIELTETVQLLRQDVVKKEKTLLGLREKVIQIDSSLNNSLTPITKTLQERLKIISDERARVDRYKALQKDIDDYNAQLNKLNELALKKIESNDEAIAQQKQVYSEFAKTVQRVLTDWQIPNVTSVAFNNAHKVFDLKINSNPRSANGKGYRAITYSAFVYGLMKYCQSKNHKHPNLLLLDSPLTTFKGRDGRTESAEEMGKDVEFAFFETLSAVNENEQIIILENKEPDEQLLSKMNYIHFSGQDGIGRPGFFS